MNRNLAKISILQLFMIFSLMSGLNSHVILNPMILDATGRDAWIAVLSTAPLYILWCLAIAWMMRKSGQRDWRDWIASSTHPAVSWALLVPVAAMLYLIGAMTVVHTTSWNTTNYMPQTPAFALALAMVVICIALALWGIGTIAVTAGVLLPVVILLGFFVSVSNSGQKDYKLLLPVLERGWSPVVDGMTYIWSGLIETILLLLMQHRLKQKMKPWHILFYGSFTVLMMVGPIIGGITEFGPEEAANQMTSPYEQWRLVRIGQYIEHVDFLSIFQWLSGACIRTSLAVLLLVELAPIRRKAVRNWWISAILASYLILALLPINNYAFYLWMYRYYMPASLAVLAAVSAVWTGITLFARQAERTNAP